MQVILLERVAKLGQMGEVVKVKEGYARNFLLPQGKALRASDANIAAFEDRSDELVLAGRSGGQRLWPSHWPLNYRPLR